MGRRTVSRTVKNKQGVPLSLLLAVLLCGFFILMSGPPFQYKAVDCAGIPDELCRELSSMAKGSGILFFPYESVRRQILRGDSSMSWVGFRPVFSGGLKLRVIAEARKPAAFLKYKGKLFGLDFRGTVFSLPAREAAPAAKESPPAIEFLGPMRIRPGEPLKASVLNLVDGILPVLASAREIRFSRIVLNRQEEWEVYTNKNIEVRAGSSQGLLDRIQLLPPILHVLGSKKFKSARIDLRYAAQPVLTVNQ